MDKLAHHKAIVRKIVTEIASMIPSDQEVETQLVADDERGHYLLNSVGWYKSGRRELSNFVHIDVRSDGKIWIQHDGTDLRIALMLVDEGIEKKDIVLGFHAPHRREMIQDFAIG